MKTTKEIKQREKEAQEAINAFIQEFHSKFGVSPRILYSLDNKRLQLSLKEIEDVANYLIKIDPLITVNDANMRLRNRQRELVLYRQCTFKIAKEMTYGPSIIADYFGWDHSTIIHSCKVVDNLLSINDKKTIHALNTIENELKERYGINGDVKPDNPERIDA